MYTDRFRLTFVCAFINDFSVISTDYNPAPLTAVWNEFNPPMWDITCLCKLCKSVCLGFSMIYCTCASWATEWDEMQILQDNSGTWVHLWRAFLQRPNMSLYAHTGKWHKLYKIHLDMSIFYYIQYCQCNMKASGPYTWRGALLLQLDAYSIMPKSRKNV